MKKKGPIVAAEKMRSAPAKQERRSLVSHDDATSGGPGRGGGRSRVPPPQKGSEEPFVGLRDRTERFEQQLILDQAIHLFYRHGYHGTSMEMIASALGVTKPYLYNRYNGKAGILTDVLARAEALALDIIIDEVNSSDPPDVKFYRSVRRFAQHALQEHELIAVYYGEARNLPRQQTARVRDIRGQWEGALAAILETGRASGMFHYRDVEVTIPIIMGMVIFVYDWFDRLDPNSYESVCEDFARAALGVAGYTGTSFDLSAPN